MRRTLLVSVMSAAAAIAATVAFEGDARACGGCFAPPENPTVVTDHRMVLSVSKQQSTLYDQIKYSGAPDSFAWVLPISGTVDVGLSADVVFAALDQMTQTQISPPPRNCPAPPDCGYRNAPSAGFGGAEDSSDAGAGVSVTKREVVGPYETVQLKATDPTALETWLANNKFSVPADVKPVIDEYVNEKFDFLALKLLPGKDVQDMRPVRVTTQGANVALPLRMVAAGTGSTVGISLWVLGEGRYQPQNFPTFTISNDELVWDWTQNKSNYTELRAQKTQAGQGKIWEIESSTLLYQQNLESAIKYGYYGGGYNGGGAPTQSADADYLPVKDDQGNVVKTADQVRQEDIATLFAGIGTATSRVTRLRADLAHAALATDLVVGAAADQSELPNVRQVTKEANQPLCPVYDGCNQVGTAPRDEAQARSSDSGGTFSCATAVKDRSGSSTWLGVGAGFLALALVNAARRRRA